MALKVELISEGNRSAQDSSRAVDCGTGGVSNSARAQTLAGPGDHPPAFVRRLHKRYLSLCPHVERLGQMLGEGVHPARRPLPDVPTFSKPRRHPVGLLPSVGCFPEAGVPHREELRAMIQAALSDPPGRHSTTGAAALVKQYDCPSSCFESSGRRQARNASPDD